MTFTKVKNYLVWIWLSIFLFLSVSSIESSLYYRSGNVWNNDDYAAFYGEGQKLVKNAVGGASTVFIGGTYPPISESGIRPTIFLVDKDWNRIVWGYYTYITSIGGNNIWGGGFRSYGEYGRGPGKFNSPQSIAVRSNGDIWVVDTGNHRVVKLKYIVSNDQVSFVGNYGSLGSGAGEFISPQQISLDRQGNVYVSDMGNHRIQKFDSNGNFIKQIGSFGESEGNFIEPVGIAVNGNYLYISDKNGMRIQKFDLNGNFIKSITATYGTTGGGCYNTLNTDFYGNVYAVGGMDSIIGMIFKFSSELELLDITLGRSIFQIFSKNSLKFIVFDKSYNSNGQWFSSGKAGIVETEQVTLMSIGVGISVESWAIASSSQDIDIHYILTDFANPLTIKVYDNQDNLVKKVYDGNATPGRKITKWDRTDNNGILVSEGEYTIEILATDIYGNSPLPSVRMISVIIGTDIKPIKLTYPQDNAIFSYANIRNISFKWDSPTIWGNTSAPIQYEIEIIPGSIFSAVSTEFIPITTLPDGDYIWRVRAVNSVGEQKSAWSESRRFRIDTTPPPAPSLVSPAKDAILSTNLPNFDWADVSDISGVKYALQVSKTLDFKFFWWTKSSGISGSEFTAPAEYPLPTDGLYYWRVLAFDEIGNITPYSSVEVRKFTIDTTPPSTPALISPADNAVLGYPLNFSWSPVSDVYPGSGLDHYEIFLSVTESADPAQSIASTTNTNFAIPSLASGYTYVWRIEAVDKVGNRSRSQLRSFSIDSTPPLAFTVRDGESMTEDIDIQFKQNELSVNWTAAVDAESGIVGYWYAIGTSPGKTEVVNWTSTNVTYVTVNNLPLVRGQRYYFGIKTRNSVGLETICWSDGVTIMNDTTVPPAPVLVSPINNPTLSTARPEFCWEHSSEPASESGVSKYVLQVNSPGGGNGGGGGPGPVGPSLESRIFYDDFQDGNDDGWNPQTGNWSVTWGFDASMGFDYTVYSEPGATTAPKLSIAGGNWTWTDFKCEAVICPEILSDSGVLQGELGIAFRIQDKNNYYFVTLSALDRRMRLYKRQNGTDTVLATSSQIVDWDWQVPTYYYVAKWLAVKVEGHLIRCYATPPQSPVGNAKFIEYTDNSFNSGGIGLYAKNLGSASFDNVRIYDTNLNYAGYEAAIAYGGEPMGPWRVQINKNLASEGHSWKVKAIDNANNESAWSTAGEFTINASDYATDVSPSYDGFAYYGGGIPYWTKIDTGIRAPNQTVTVGLDFEFPFYGNRFSNINICANGWVSFTHSGDESTNLNFPSPQMPNTIAVLLNDWCYADNSRVYFEYVAEPVRKFVVQWHNLYHKSACDNLDFGSYTPADFEVVLYETGEIFGNYLTLDQHHPSGVTIGANSGDGINGYSIARFPDNYSAVEIKIYSSETSPPSTPAAPGFSNVTSNSFLVTSGSSQDSGTGINPVSGYRFDCLTDDRYDRGWGERNFTGSNAQANTNYTFRTQARDLVNNESFWSSIASVCTLANIPSELTATGGYNAQVKQITLTWQANNNPEGTVYELYNVETNTTLYTGVNTSFVHSGLEAGVTCSYKVRAINQDNIPTVWTAEIEGNTLSSPTISRYVTGELNSGRNRVYLTWQAVPGAKSYVLWIFDGYMYRQHNISNVAFWDSAAAKIYPKPEDLAVVSDENIFRFDGAGENLKADFNELYRRFGSKEHYYTAMYLASVDEAGRLSGDFINGATFCGGEMVDTDPPSIPGSPVFSNVTSTSMVVVSASSVDSGTEPDALYPGSGIHNSSPYMFQCISHPWLSRDWGLQNNEVSGLEPNTEYVFNTASRDNAGNYSLYGVTGSIYTSPSLPEVICNRDTNKYYNTNPWMFTNVAGFGSGGVNHYHYKWTQEPVSTVSEEDLVWSTGELSLTATREGWWYLHIISHGREHNFGGTATYGPYGYDNISPTVTINSPKEGTKYVITRDTITLDFSVTDNLDPAPGYEATLTHKVTGMVINVISGQTIAPADLSAGQWCLLVSAGDWADNFGYGEIYFEVIHDMQPPRTIVEITNPKFQIANKTYARGDTVFQLSAIDDMVVVGDAQGMGVARTIVSSEQLTVSRFENPSPAVGAVFVSSFNLINLADGEQIISYYSIDTFNNVESTKTVSVTIDNTSPTSSVSFIGDKHINLLTNNIYVSSRTGISIVSDDGTGAGVGQQYYKLSAMVDFEVYSQPLYLFTEGENRVWYYSTDNLSNTETPAKETKFYLDVTPPNNWSKFKPSEWILDWTPDCSIEVYENMSGVNFVSGYYQYSVDGGINYSNWLAVEKVEVLDGNGKGWYQLVAKNVPFNQASANKNKIRFKVSDNVNNIGVSTEYTVRMLLLATVNIDPDTLNLKSEGRWITGYLEYPAGYKLSDTNLKLVRVTQVNGLDITSIYCEPKPVSIGEDNDGDGIPELMVKFSREQIGSVSLPWTNAKYTIETALVDGTRVIGWDSVRIISPPQLQATQLPATQLQSTQLQVKKNSESASNDKVSKDTKTQETKVQESKTQGSKPDDTTTQDTKTNNATTGFDARKFEPKVLFDTKLKFNNGNLDNVLTMNNGYPNWRNRWVEEKKKFDEKLKPQEIVAELAKNNHGQGLKLGNADDNKEKLVYTYTTVIDSGTGELVWHSNFGNHSGQFKDLREEYKKDVEVKKLWTSAENWDNKTAQVNKDKTNQQGQPNQGQGQQKDKDNNSATADQKQQKQDNQGKDNKQDKPQNQGQDNQNNGNNDQPGNQNNNQVNNNHQNQNQNNGQGNNDNQGQNNGNNNNNTANNQGQNQNNGNDQQNNNNNQPQNNQNTNSGNNNNSDNNNNQQNNGQQNNNSNNQGNNNQQNNNSQGNQGNNTSGSNNQGNNEQNNSGNNQNNSTQSNQGNNQGKNK